MELTGDLDQQAESAATKEEQKEAAKKADMPLADDKLDMVSGGAGSPPSDVFPDDFDFDPFIRDNHILLQYEDARD